MYAETSNVNPARVMGGLGNATTNLSHNKPVYKPRGNILNLRAVFFLVESIVDEFFSCTVYHSTKPPSKYLFHHIINVLPLQTTSLNKTLLSPSSA